MARSSRISAATQASDRTLPTERNAAAQLVAFMSRSSVQVVDAGGQRLNLPAPLAKVVKRAAELMARGHAVTVLADEQTLTTQKAAEILNVSRQYLVRLVDSGRLPAVKVGSHRRLRAIDVEGFRAARDQDRAAALDELAALSEEIGGYAVEAPRWSGGG